MRRITRSLLLACVAVAAVRQPVGRRVAFLFVLGAAACGARSELDYGFGSGNSDRSGSGSNSSSLMCTADGMTVDVSVGGSSCALKKDGSVACWGNNRNGTIGDGTTKDSFVPVAIKAPSSLTSVSTGARVTCGLTAAGTVACWGTLNFKDGSPSTVPVEMAMLGGGISAVSVGDGEACALTKLGVVKCWGSSPAPAEVPGLEPGVSAISAGYRHTCALLNSGGVRCWGNNASGELGDGTRVDRHAPVDVVGLSSGIAAIASGTGYTCALTGNGAVKCWGILGSEALLNSSVPVDIPGFGSKVSSISAGSGHACAITANGAAKCWGANVYGKLGNGMDDAPTSGTAGRTIAPVDVVGLDHGVFKIAAGIQQTCAVVSGCHVMCWGENFSGELGNNDPHVTSSHVPVQVTGL